MEELPKKTMYGTILIVLGILFCISCIYSGVTSSYEYNNKFGYLWEMSDRSSTLSAKEQYISQFVDALNSSRQQFADNGNLFFQTSATSFDSNFKAVITLGDRLREVGQMDPTSFQYNTAIEQITAQEQGQADDMIHVFRNCYSLKNYILDSYYGLLLTVIGIIMISIGFLKIFGE